MKLVPTGFSVFHENRMKTIFIRFFVIGRPPVVDERVGQGFSDGQRGLVRVRTCAGPYFFPPNECGLEVMRPVSVNEDSPFITSYRHERARSKLILNGEVTRNCSYHHLLTPNSFPRRKYPSQIAGDQTGMANASNQ
jgi:hypothetical protein